MDVLPLPSSSSSIAVRCLEISHLLALPNRPVWTQHSTYTGFSKVHSLGVWPANTLFCFKMRNTWEAEGRTQTCAADCCTQEVGGMSTLFWPISGLMMYHHGSRSNWKAALSSPISPYPKSSDVNICTQCLLFFFWRGQLKAELWKFWVHAIKPMAVKCRRTFCEGS